MMNNANPEKNQMHPLPLGPIKAGVGRLEDEVNRNAKTVNVDAIVPVGDIEPGRIERLMHAASKLGSAALQTSRTALEQLPLGGASVSWHPEQSDSSGQKEE